MSELLSFDSKFDPERDVFTDDGEVRLKDDDSEFIDLSPQPTAYDELDNELAELDAKRMAEEAEQLRIEQRIEAEAEKLTTIGIDYSEARARAEERLGISKRAS